MPLSISIRLRPSAELVELTTKLGIMHVVEEIK